jgi:hypothetical protein
VGAVNGPDALLGYCHVQLILTDRMGGRQTSGHHPYSAARDAGMQKFMRLLWGTRVGRWLA